MVCLVVNHTLLKNKAINVDYTLLYLINSSSFSQKFKKLNEFIPFKIRKKANPTICYCLFSKTYYRYMDNYNYVKYLPDLETKVTGNLFDVCYFRTKLV